MSNNAKFITADRLVFRYDGDDEIQLRLISENVVMFTNLGLKEMKDLRDFLNRYVDEIETFQE